MFEIGSSLREARTRQGLELDELEQRTKIRAKYLRALEDEQFSVLPGDSYVKGFLRTYADALGLEGQLYVDEYNSRFPDGEEVALPRAGRAAGTRPRRRERRESSAVVLVILGIAVVTALVIAAWRFGGSPGAESVENLPPSGGAASTIPAGRVTVEIRAAKGSSYADVRAGSATGRPLFVGTLARGDVQRFRAPSVYVSLAAPANVVVRVNGSRVQLPAGGEALLGADGVQSVDGS